MPAQCNPLERVFSLFQYPEWAKQRCEDPGDDPREWGLLVHDEAGDRGDMSQHSTNVAFHANNTGSLQ